MTSDGLAARSMVVAIKMVIKMMVGGIYFEEWLTSIFHVKVVEARFPWRRCWRCRR